MQHVIDIAAAWWRSDLVCIERAVATSQQSAPRRGPAATIGWESPPNHRRMIEESPAAALAHGLLIVSTMLRRSGFVAITAVLSLVAGCKGMGGFASGLGHVAAGAAR